MGKRTDWEIPRHQKKTPEVRELVMLTTSMRSGSHQVSPWLERATIRWVKVGDEDSLGEGPVLPAFEPDLASGLAFFDMVVCCVEVVGVDV